MNHLDRSPRQRDSLGDANQPDEGWRISINASQGRSRVAAEGRRIPATPRDPRIDSHLAARGDSSTARPVSATGTTQPNGLFPSSQLDRIGKMEAARDLHPIRYLPVNFSITVSASSIAFSAAFAAA